MLGFVLAFRRLGKVTSGGLWLTWLAFALCGLPELYWWIHVAFYPLVGCNAHLAFAIRAL